MRRSNFSWKLNPLINLLTPKIQLSPKAKRFLKHFSLAILGCILLNGLMFTVPSLANTPRHYTDLTFGELPEVEIPDYQRLTLANGLVVYLVEDHELPLVSGTAIFRVGSRWEPSEQAGLASLTGYLLRDGGTQDHSFEEINQFLEQRAASIETTINITAGQASFNALREDLDSVFDLFVEILRRPSFEEDRLQLAQSLSHGGIERRNDDPNDIAQREFKKLLYGDASPYARTPEYATLDNINRADVVQFYQQFVHPNRMILGLVGDFDPDMMTQKIEQTLGDWSPTPDPIPTIPEVNPRDLNQVFVVEQPHLTQSYVYMGHLGGMRDHPDYPALTVLNEVLNGQGGRLYNEVRSRQGLAYSVYSFWQAYYDFPGFFVAGGQTRTETTIPFIEAIRQEVEAVREAPITPEELKYAKDVVQNSLVFSFETPGQTLSRLMRYEYYGYPPDFLFQYHDAVKAVTVDDIYRVANTYLQPDQLFTLVVGDLAEVEGGLSQLSPTGDVEILDITIPPAG
jgi:zinc protease